ncbi:hypothetical protein CC86DRAFT_429087 [Ophiobolus disseminans]|uniref:Uncharacterized protein n=1 Tax=Ophiobolus disseminans TaxID=1469910 RepID=A0A6A6ZI43_9PLEO|nr:hypothetical protein CC86DRAFT_429087 [Ophiobolus disseminans]
MITTPPWESWETYETFASFSSPKPHSRFMDLPPELRVQVYKHLVVVSKIFYTPCFYESKEDGRFHTSRVKADLRGGFGDLPRKNLFVLPQDYNYRMLFNDYGVGSPLVRNGYRPLFPAVGLNMITNMSIAFIHSFDLPLVMDASEWPMIKAEGLEDYKDLTPDNRCFYAHEMGKEKLLGYWRGLANAMGKIIKGLSYLEIDLTSAFCPAGCCRILEIDFDFLVRLKPKVIRVVGLHEGEKYLLEIEMKNAFPDQELKDVGITLVCDGVEDPWAKFCFPRRTRGM